LGKSNPAGAPPFTGKRMRHVKRYWGQPVDDDAVTALIVAAYDDMHARLRSVQQTI